MDIFGESKTSGLEHFTLEQMLEDNLPEPILKEVKRILYGREIEKLDMPKLEKGQNCDLQGYKMGGADAGATSGTPYRPRGHNPACDRVTNDGTVARTARGHLQEDQRLHRARGRVRRQHCLFVFRKDGPHMPFAFCPREKYPWCEFAEDALTGPSTDLLSNLARKHNMVIVSPILERDHANKGAGFLWNAAVVIGPDGKVIGKERKNHIPRKNDFNESTYYMESTLGHPVFDTPYGKIAA